MIDLMKYLKENPYPGRGIALGRSADGRRSVAVYFIMGRSVNSRNRIFEETEDGIRTKAFDESKMTDPSLIIYHPVREVGKGLIVTNGDQTDTVRDFLVKGQSFEQALRTREFEPDGPNWTPRISGLLSPDGSYKLSILKAADREGSACVRYTFEYPGLSGGGHFISTYETDGNPLPSFRGEPRAVSFGDETPEELAEKVWAALNADNKVSLYVRTADLVTGEARVVIINKHQED